MHGGKIGSSVQRNHSLEHFYSKVLHSNTTSQTRLKKPRQLESHLKPKFTKSLKYQTLDVADQIARDVTRLLGGIKDVWVLLKCENKSENFKENKKYHLGSCLKPDQVFCDRGLTSNTKRKEGRKEYLKMLKVYHWSFLKILRPVAQKKKWKAQIDVKRLFKGWLERVLAQIVQDDKLLLVGF